MRALASVSQKKAFENEQLHSQVLLIGNGCHRLRVSLHFLCILPLFQGGSILGSAGSVPRVASIWGLMHFRGTCDVPSVSPLDSPLLILVAQGQMMKKALEEEEAMFTRYVNSVMADVCSCSEPPPPWAKFLQLQLVSRKKFPTSIPIECRGEITVPPGTGDRVSTIELT